jgi:hypothetical protein
MSARRTNGNNAILRRRPALALKEYGVSPHLAADAMWRDSAKDIYTAYILFIVIQRGNRLRYVANPEKANYRMHIAILPFRWKPFALPVAIKVDAARRLEPMPALLAIP